MLGDWRPAKISIVTTKEALRKKKNKDQGRHARRQQQWSGEAQAAKLSKQRAKYCKKWRETQKHYNALSSVNTIN